MYIRFVVRQRNSKSDQPNGIFTALGQLENQGELADHELSWFREIESWFNEHLARPQRLAWSTRPNAPERAITWLKISAAGHVRRMRELASLLEHKDIPVQELRTDRPGYITYEDEHQVAAIPFTGEPIDTAG
jgi:hypothetical protein